MTLVHAQLVWCRCTCSSSACHRSLLITGVFPAVIQPRFFQPWIQVVTPFFMYSESVVTSTSHGSLKG